MMTTDYPGKLPQRRASKYGDERDMRRAKKVEKRQSMRRRKQGQIKIARRDENKSRDAEKTFFAFGFEFLPADVDTDVQRTREGSTTRISHC